MKEIGKLLKEKRDSLKISLEEVSAATKINIKILQSLEAGDLEKLPAKTFVRGFVQTYAKYLGLDSKEVLAKLQETIGSTRPKTPVYVPDLNASNEPTAAKDRIMSKSMSSGGSWITGVVIVVLILSIIVIQKIVSRREAEMKVAGIQAITGNDSPVNIPAPLPPASDLPVPVPTASVGLTPLIPAPTPTPPPLVPPAAKPEVKPEAKIEVKKTVVVAAPTPSPIPKETPKSTPVAVVVPSPTPVAVVVPVPVEDAPLVPQTMIIEALNNVSIKVSIDGKAAQEINMASDQIQTFKAKGKIRISTTNGGAISVIHNGHEIGVPGNLGQPKTLAFP